MGSILLGLPLFRSELFFYKSCCSVEQVLLSTVQGLLLSRISPLFVGLPGQLRMPWTLARTLGSGLVNGVGAKALARYQRTIERITDRTTIQRRTEGDISGKLQTALPKPIVRIGR